MTQHGFIDVDGIGSEKELRKLLPAQSKYTNKECGDVRRILLDEKREKVIHLEGMFWRSTGVDEATGEPNGEYGDDTTPFMELDVQQSMALAGVIHDPLLQFQEDGSPLNFITSFQDFALLNGVFMPNIRITQGVYHRFRLVNTFVMRWLDVSVRMQ